MAGSNSPIFDLLCFEYPELQWQQDVTKLTTLQGEVVREVFGPLRVL